MCNVDFTLSFTRPPYITAPRDAIYTTNLGYTISNRAPRVPFAACKLAP